MIAHNVCALDTPQPISLQEFSQSKRKHLVIVTDAWLPQTNGVVTTLQATMGELSKLGVDTTVIHPGLFSTIPMPGYREIRLALKPNQLRHQLLALRPDAIHVATEGPLGVAARRWLAKRSVPFTTAIHTKFPEYVNKRTGMPLRLGYRMMRWFHDASDAALCATPTHQKELADRGLSKLRVWSKGVDTELYQPVSRADVSKQNLLYVGRVAIEKSVEDFLKLDTSANKIVVGDGPARESLQHQYPQADWRGYLWGKDLAQAYAEADVLVFPSRTDTFGLVMLEAMACGTPVAAYPVTGPNDVVSNNVSGILNDCLLAAVEGAMKLDRKAVRRYAEQYSWRETAECFWRLQSGIDWERLGCA